MTAQRTEEMPTEVLGLRVSALVEMALFFSALLLLDTTLLDGSRFRDVSPHPFWIAVILVSLQYGTNEGLLCAAASSAALLVGNVPPQTLSLDLFAYLFELSKTPLMWAAAALIVGELRSRQLRERSDLRRRLAASEMEAQVITAAHDSVQAAKDELEARIAGQFRTLLTVFRAAMAVERMEVSGVIAGAEALITAILNPEKFSIFLLKDERLDVVDAYGWADDDKLTRSFGSGDLLYRRVIAERSTLCVVREDDEQALAGEGVLAGPLQDPETGEVYGLLRIEALGLLDLTGATLENFDLLCDWLGSNLAVARRFEDASSDRILDPEAGLLTAHLFERQKTFVLHLATRVGFDLTLLIIEVDGDAALGRDVTLSIGRTVAVAVAQSLRDTDLAFQWQPAGRRFAVLLPATNAGGGRLVVRKLRDDINFRLNVLAERVKLTFEVEELHRHDPQR